MNIRSSMGVVQPARLPSATVDPSSRRQSSNTTDATTARTHNRYTQQIRQLSIKSINTTERDAIVLPTGQSIERTSARTGTQCGGIFADESS